MLKTALLLAWSAASAFAAVTTGAIIYLGSGLAPSNRTADIITTIVLILVFIGWVQATLLIVRRLKTLVKQAPAEKPGG